MHIHICTCIHTCIHIHAHIQKFIHASTCTHSHTCVHAFTYAYVCINVCSCTYTYRYVLVIWKSNLYWIVLFRVGVVFLVLLLSACGGLFRYYYRRWYTEGSGLPYIPFPASPAYSSLPTHISNQEPLFQVQCGYYYVSFKY